MRSLGKRLSVGFGVLLAVVLIGATGYYFIGGGRWAFGDCVYMTVITITTVGYGETLEGMDKVEYARGFTMFLLVFGTGAIAFFASLVIAVVVEGELKEALFASKMKKRMKRMENHVVVCGAGSTGRAVIEEMLKTNTAVIAVDVLEHELKEIADKYPKAEFAYVAGDATDDDVFAQLNVGVARGIIAALSSDKDNLYLTVSARQTNPKIRIVARAAEVSHIEKLKRAGADAVVSPNFIGGMRLVSEMVRPAVVGFLDTMLRDKRATYRIEEITLDDKFGKLGTTLGDARVHERFGMNVLAVSRKDKEYTYNPGPTEKLEAGVTLVVLGSADQVATLRKEIA